MIIGTISLFAKFGTLLGAMAKDMAKQFDDLSKTFIETRKSTNFEKQIQSKQRLIEIIQFHSVAKLYVTKMLFLTSIF